MSGSAGKSRFDEPGKWLPVVFVCCNISGLYIIYMLFHCIPRLQSSIPAAHRNETWRNQAILEMIALHLITALLLYCYVKSVLVTPGEVPDDDPQWERAAEDPTYSEELSKDNMQERKRSGDRRYCKWCGKYKPDRCHHCRVCKSCILKMDHHCPWIYNCVGFRNHKYFFLLLLYSVLDCQLIMWTMIDSVKKCILVDTPFLHMFCLLFGETLACFLGVLVTAFFFFHIWLMLKAMTTIEFCEKSLKKGGSYDSSLYDHGCYGNITSVLGNNPLLWLVPISLPEGNGLNFITETTPLTIKNAGGSGVRKKGHQKVQRSQKRHDTTPGASGSFTTAQE